jgi:hypothetical protein
MLKMQFEIVLGGAGSNGDPFGLAGGSVPAALHSRIQNADLKKCSELASSWRSISPEKLTDVRGLRNRPHAPSMITTQGWAGPQMRRKLPVTLIRPP